MTELTFYRTYEEFIQQKYGLSPVEYLLRAERLRLSPEDCAREDRVTTQTVRNLMARHGFGVTRHICRRECYGEDTAGAADGRAAAGGVR